MHHTVGAGFYIERIAALVVVLLILALLFFLLYRVLKQSGGIGGHSAAIRELEMRYARGEIDRGDYWQRRTDLVSALVPPPAVTPPPPDAGGAPKPPARGATAAS